MPNICPPRDELARFSTGHLDNSPAEEIATHVDSCANCRTVLEELSRTADYLALALRQPGDLPFAEEAALAAALPRVQEIRVEPSSASELTTGQNPPTAAISVSQLKAIRDYEILEKLGEGGMGAVYKAKHRRLKKSVALKVLPRDKMLGADAIARFEREMEAVGKLEHPNLVRAMDAGESEGTHFLVMEYVAGADLSQLVKQQGPLRIADACELIRQAAVGLQHVHEQGLVHRDIKPSNLMLSPTGTVKILDLGLALLSGDNSPGGRELTTTGQMMGTIDYMAPEQGGDTHNVDIRADIYSLGATLYKLLTGIAPFGDPKFDTPVKKLMALATQEPTPIQQRRTDVPPTLAAVVGRMLAKSPAKRYATPADLVKAMTPFASGSDLVAILAISSNADLKKGTEDTCPSLKSASVDTMSPVFHTASPGANVWHRFQNLPLSLRVFALTVLVLVIGGGAWLGAPIILYWETPQGTVRIEIDDAAIKAQIDEDGLLITGADKKPIKIRAAGDAPDNKAVEEGKHRLLIKWDDREFETDTFELKKNGRHTLQIKLIKGQVQVAANGKTLKVEPSAGTPSVASSAPPPFAVAPFDAAQAKKHQVAWATYLGVPVEWKNSIGMRFRLIPPGEFLMGGTAEEIAVAIQAEGQSPNWRVSIDSESPRHRVILTKPMYMGIHEITQGQYRDVTGTNPSHFSETGGGKTLIAGLDTASHPVEFVDWNDAVQFCATLSQLDKLQESKGYRLPTAAEWEFACRAGTTSKHIVGDRDEDLKSIGWYVANSQLRTHAVGELRSNPFGLFDTLGNVWEWVQDGFDPAFYSSFEKTAAIDPLARAKWMGHHEARGGGLDNGVATCRASFRGYSPGKQQAIGIRVTLTVEAVRQLLSQNARWPADAPPPAIAPFDADQAKKHQVAWATYLGVPVEWENSIGMKFRLIPPGEFTMGSTREEVDENLQFATYEHWRESLKSELPQHKVILTSPIYLAATEVTQGQFSQVLGRNPSAFSSDGALKARVAGLDTSRFPVELVSWNDAAEFCAKLSDKEKQRPDYFRAGEVVTMIQGTGYRLPTEAHWEFACRAGTTTRYSTGNEVDRLRQTGWVAPMSGDRTHAVGELAANPFGLFDMHGNVCEWVQDTWSRSYYAQFRDRPAINPGGAEEIAPKRVLRSGNWNNGPLDLRSGYRFSQEPTMRFDGLGFRVALPVEAVRQLIRAKTNRALEFDGKSSRVEIPGLKPTTAEPITLEAFVKFDKAPGELQAIASAYDPSSALMIGRNSGSPVFLARQELETQMVGTSGATKDGEWLHLAGVWDGKMARLYINGKLHDKTRAGVATKQMIASQNQYLMLGAEFGIEGSPPVNFLHGLLDEVRLSKIARYDKEFKPPAVGERFEIDTHTLALYHCDEGSGDELKDSSAHNHHGKIVGAKWVQIAEPGVSAIGVTPAPLSIPDPPPLAEWLKGRTVLTVAQDGSGQFKTIQTALDALQQGQVIKVLDKGPYREQLDVPALPKDTGLVSEVQTVLEATAWKRFYTDRAAGEAIDIYVAHKLNRPEGFRLHGFEMRFPRAEGKRVKLLATGATKGNFVLENCAFHAAANSNGASLELSDRVQSTNDGLGMSVSVRDCVFHECLVLSAHHLRVPPDPNHVSTAVIERNFFAGTGTEFQLMFAGQSMDQLAIRHNVFAGKSRRDMHLHAVNAAALELSNNTLTSTIGLSMQESIPRGSVIIRNNLRSREGFVELQQGAERYMAQASRNWIMDHNVHPEPSAGASPSNALPRSPGDPPSMPRFLSKVPQDANYLRIPVDDTAATSGAGGDWPTFIGALPPGPAPADGDWFTRLRTRWIQKVDFPGQD